MLESRKKAEAINSLGVLQRQKGNYEAAIVEYKKAIEIDPQYVVAYNNLGTVYYRLNKFDMAIEQFKKAIIIDPNYLLAYMRLAASFRRKKEITKAITIYEKVIAKNPDYLEAYYNLGLVYRALKKFNAAAKNFHRVTELDPENKIAHLYLGREFNVHGEYEKAIKCFEKALLKDPKFVDAKLSLGVAHFKMDAFDAAIAVLEDVVSTDNYDHVAMYFLGSSYYRLAQYDKAGGYLEQVYKINPTYEGVSSKLAQVKIEKARELIATGNQYKAIDLLKAMVKKEPQEEPLLRELVDCYESLKGEKDKFNNYEELYKLSPKNIYIRNVLLEKYQRMIDTSIADGKNAMAAMFCKEYLKIIPSDHEVRFKLAAIYENQGMIEESVHEYMSIQQLDPDYQAEFIAEKMQEFSGQRISLLKKHGKENDLIDEYKNLLESDPDNLNVLYELAELLEKNESLSEAFDTYERIVEKDPAYRDTAVLLREKYHAMGVSFYEKMKLNEAREYLVKANDRDPDFIPTMMLLAEIAKNNRDELTAMNYYERVFKLDRQYKGVKDNLSNIYMWRSRVLFHDRDYEAAIEIYQKFLQIRPDKTSQICYKIALMKEKQKLLFDTLEVLAKIELIDPDFKEARHKKKEIYAKLSQQYTEDEIKIKLASMDADESQITSSLEQFYFESAEHVIKKCKYQQALDLLNKIIVINPGSVIMKERLAYVYRQLGMTAEALAEYRRVLDFSIADYDLRRRVVTDCYDSGEFFFGRELYDQAIKFYEIVVEQDPENVSALYKIAVINDQLGKYELAIELFEQVRDLNPGYHGLDEILTDVYRRQVDQFAINPAYYNKAIEIYRFLLEKDPDDPQLIFKYALVYENSGDLRSALKYFKEAKAKGARVENIDARIAEIDIQLIDLLADDEEKYREVIREKRKVFDQKVDDLEAFYSLGVAYQSKDITSEALKVFHKIIEINPEYMDVLVRLCNIYEGSIEKFLEGQKYSEALAQIKKLIALAGETDNVRTLLGFALLKNGKYADALKIFTEMIEKGAITSDNLSNQGLCYTELEEYKKALACFDEALKFGDNIAQIYNNIGAVYTKMSDFSTAMEYYGKAVSIDPTIKITLSM